MVASPTTYPGSVLPLRGLQPFVESDRDALVGRDKDRDAVAKLITQEGVRAGLLLGEPGVGKTSLLRAGLLPHLRDHGVVAVICDDNRQPSQSFAAAIQAATKQAPKSGEKPMDFLARVVSQALQGQLFVFLVDDIGLALRSDHDGQLTHELGDLFARVATRSGGRARFLFSCAEHRMHYLDALERRTGSLFPPPTRYHLSRFTVPQAHDVLEKTLALAAVSNQPELSKAVAEELGRAGMILPAELQIIARVIAEKKIHSAGDLKRLGGASALVPRWIEGCADTTGDRAKGLRLLAELGATAEGPALDAGQIAARAGLEPEFAARSLPHMAAIGILSAVSAEGQQPAYALAHEVLASRVHDLAVPASESARRAREALGARATRGARLSLFELARVHREGIVPSTADEARTIALSKRFYLTVAVGALAAPILILILIYLALTGTYHLSAERGPAGQRLLVRSGRPGLSSFWWLPHLGGPSFGSVVADTGFTPAMVDAEAWQALADRDVVGKLGAESKGRREFVVRSLEVLRPQLRGLLRYALSGDDESPLVELRATATTPTDWVTLLGRLKPIARGGPEETKLVGDALAHEAPAVRRAALELALEVARRKPPAYRDAIAAALAGADEGLRRLAFAAARAMGGEREAELLSAAMALNPAATARADLLAAFAAQKTSDAAAQAAAAVGILAAEGVDGPTRQTAWDMLERAFQRDAKAAAPHAARLAGEAKAEAPARIRALGLLEDRGPRDVAPDLATHVESALSAQSVQLRAAALPLYARFSPLEAVGKLSTEDPAKEVRAATAAAWGELMASHPKEAEAALRVLLDDRSGTVRAAAARAWGRMGRPAQEKLLKLAEDGGFEVAEGAAYGLAASLEAGGLPGETMSGIGQLWKKKGAQRRAAARIYGRVARKKPSIVLSHLTTASRTKDDAQLRAIGVDGLCQVLATDDKKAAREAVDRLYGAAGDESRDVRARVAACVAARPASDADDETVSRVAPRLAEDEDASVRADAARALAQAARTKAGKATGPALAKLVADPERSVRLAAAEGLASLQGDPPAGVDEKLRIGWARADSEEKLLLLAAAQATGATDLVRIAAGDGSPAVRARALPAVVVLGVDVPALLGAAFTDADPQVRREALRLLGDPATKVAEADAVRALEIATGDRDASVAEAALAALASLEPVDVAERRLAAAFADPSERERTKAARASVGLVARDAAAAVKVLEPALADAAHDVRVAVVGSLGAAYAASRGPTDLAQMLNDSERDAVKRLAIADALLRLAAAEGGVDAVAAAVGPVAETGRPMGRLTAQLVVGLARGGTGPAFLSEIIP